MTEENFACLIKDFNNKLRLIGRNNSIIVLKGAIRHMDNIIRKALITESDISNKIKHETE